MEVETLLGDASEAREKLGWSPPSSLSELIALLHWGAAEYGYAAWPYWTTQQAH